MNRRANMSVTFLLLSSRTFARLSSEHSGWIIALSCSNLLPSAARFVAIREFGPLAKLAVHRTDFQEAGLLFLVYAEAIAVFAVPSRLWILAQSTPGLATFAAVLRAIAPNRPFCITSVGRSSEEPVISSYENTS